jgi:hypothetical protein
VTVLCGGKGTRLGEPIKCLTEVAGRPFMDWKVEQLQLLGATAITLVVGPYLEQFRRRYGQSVFYRLDPQLGVRHAVGATEGWWTMGDVLLDQPLVGEHVMFVRPGAQIAGLFLDCGLYHGPGPWQMRETRAVPHHINTRADLEETGAHLRRHGLAG